MRCFILLVYCLHSVYTGIEDSPYSQLLYLQEITKQFEKEGNYPERNTGSLIVTLDEVSLIISTQSDINGTRISFLNASRITELTTFNTSHETVIYIHGWLDDIKKSAFQLKSSLLNASNLNVVILDWDKCSENVIYFVSWGCVEAIGNYLGDFLSTVYQTYDYSLDNVTLVGHSLGAHIAGFAGQRINGTLGSIIGLDPANPFFFKGQATHRLDITDAKFVEVIHTSANFVGINYNIGHVDFWPNGGHRQNGCGLDPFGECAHKRAPTYYAESVELNDFGAKQCGSYSDFQSGKCANNTSAIMGGLELVRKIQGTYYLETNKQPPYGKGYLS